MMTADAALVAALAARSARTAGVILAQRAGCRHTAGARAGAARRDRREARLMTNRFAASPGFGANLIAPDRTRFTIWAPDCDRVMLEIDGMPPIPMQAESGMFSPQKRPCGAGRRYYGSAFNRIFSCRIRPRAPRPAMCTMRALSLTPVRMNGVTPTGAAGHGMRRRSTNFIPAVWAASPAPRVCCRNSPNWASPPWS